MIHSAGHERSGEYQTFPPTVEQGAAFGVTQGAWSLGRSLGPPLAAAAYVVADWSPFIAGTLLLVPVALLLRR